jgi:hypothetical protein
MRVSLADFAFLNSQSAIRNSKLHLNGPCWLEADSFN